jgi:hypothetical protein
MAALSEAARARAPTRVGRSLSAPLAAGRSILEPRIHAGRECRQARRRQSPAFITDRGKPAFALLRIEDDYRIAGRAERSLLALMDSLPATPGIEFDAPRADIVLQVPESE